MHKDFKNITKAFEQIYYDVMTSGVDQGNTKALFNYSFTISDVEDKVVHTSWRKFKTSYAEKEWDWYLSGNPNAEEISKSAKIWKNHMDENGDVNSNYGYQWKRSLGSSIDQLDYVVKELTRDNQSRRAVISLYDGKEHSKYQFDTPCTLSIHFYFKPNDDRLHSTVNMRSNDVYFGLCNDFYCFAKLLELVANRLGVNVGTYTHVANNMHVYDSQFKLFKNVDKNIFRRIARKFSNNSITTKIFNR